MGSICTFDSSEEARDCSKADGDPPGVCNLPGGETFANALTDGFDVPEFPRADWTMVEGLEWKAPSSAQFVACAAFICPPVIRERDGHATIVNYDRCVVSNIEALGNEGTFDPRDPERSYRPSESNLLDLAPGCAAADLDAIPNMTGIWVGCWAYDEANLIAATRLTELPIDSGIVPSEWIASEIGTCSSADELRNCALLPTALVGTCKGGMCRPRCLSTSSCPTGLKCNILEDEFLGLCEAV